jgi:hypothetical protein
MALLVVRDALFDSLQDAVEIQGLGKSEAALFHCNLIALHPAMEGSPFTLVQGIERFSKQIVFGRISAGRHAGSDTLVEIGGKLIRHIKIVA